MSATSVSESGGHTILSHDQGLSPQRCHDQATWSPFSSAETQVNQAVIREVFAQGSDSASEAPMPSRLPQLPYLIDSHCGGTPSSGCSSF